MAMPASAHRYWTPADVLAEFPESNSTRYECVDGILLVTPAPRSAHVAVQQRLAGLIAGAIEPTALLSRVVVALADVRLDADALVQPDLFVLPSALPSGVRWEDMPCPLLVVEVLSPSTASIDRGRKRSLYQRAGVPEYWIVDLDARCIERWTAEAHDADVRSDDIAWTDPVTGTHVELNLPEFFTSVLGGAAPTDD